MRNRWMVLTAAVLLTLCCALALGWPVRAAGPPSATPEPLAAPDYTGVGEGAPVGGPASIVGPLTQADLDAIPTGWHCPENGIGAAPGIDGTVYALELGEDGYVYVGGDFQLSTSTSDGYNVARRNPTIGAWETLNCGAADAAVRRLMLDHGALHLAGDFYGGYTARIEGECRWLGTLSGPAYTLEAAGDTIIVGGDFENVALWQGTTLGGILNLAYLQDGEPDSWSRLDPSCERCGVASASGSAEGAYVASTLLLDDKLYVAGSFSQGIRDDVVVATTNIACWDMEARQWSALPRAGQANVAFTYPVTALATDGTYLYIAAYKTLTPGGYALYRYDPREGGTLDELSSSDTDADRIYTLAVCQHSLFVGGSGNIADTGGPLARYQIPHTQGVIKGTWQSMGTITGGSVVGGVDQTAVHALAVDGANLWVGGDFGSVNGHESHNVALWVQPVADLSVGFRPYSEHLYAGANLAGEYLVAHNGYARATGVELYAKIEYGTNGSVVTECLASDLAVHAMGERHASTYGTMTLPADIEPGSLVTMTYSLSADQYDPELANNEVVHVFPVETKAELQLEMSAPESVTQCEPYTIVFTITNQGPSVAREVFVAYEPTIWEDPAGDSVFVKDMPMCFAPIENGYGGSIGDMEPTGATSQKTISATVVMLDAETYGHHVRAQTEGGCADTWPATLALPGDGLCLCKTDLLRQAGVFEPLTYTVRLSNMGDARATGVEIVDTLPEHTVLDSVTSDKGTCSSADDTVVCSPGALDPDEAVHVTLVVEPQRSGMLTNTVTASADGLPSVSDVDSDTEASNCADLSVVITPPTGASPGTACAYTVAIKNAGPRAAENIVVTHTLEAGVYLESASLPEDLGATCVVHRAPGQPHTVVCNFGALAVRGEVHLSVSAVPLGTGEFAATAQLSGSLLDDVPGNNTADASLVATGQGAEVVPRTYGGLDVWAYVVYETACYGVIGIGNCFCLADATGWLTMTETSLVGHGTLAYQAGADDEALMPVYAGELVAASSDWMLDLPANAEGALSEVAGFAIDNCALDSVNLSTGEVEGSTTALHIEPPFCQAQASATFTIGCDRSATCTISEAFDLSASGFRVGVPANAQLEDGEIQANVTLKMPAYYCPDGTSREADATVVITPVSLSLEGTEGDGTFVVPDLNMNGNTSDRALKITDGRGVFIMVMPNGPYCLDIGTSQLSLGLVGQSYSMAMPRFLLYADGRLDHEGSLPEFSVVMGGGTLAVKGSRLSKDGIAVAQASFAWPNAYARSGYNIKKVAINPAGDLSMNEGAPFQLPDRTVQANGQHLDLIDPMGTIVPVGDQGYALNLVGGKVLVRLPQQNERYLNIEGGSAEVDGALSVDLGDQTLELDVATTQLVLSNLSLNSDAGLVATHGEWRLAAEQGGGVLGFDAHIVIDREGLRINMSDGSDTSDASVMPFPDLRPDAGFLIQDNHVTLEVSDDRSYQLEASGTISVTIPGSAAESTADFFLDAAGFCGGRTGGMSFKVGGMTLELPETRFLADGTLEAVEGLWRGPADFGGNEVDLERAIKLTAEKGLDVGQSLVSPGNDTELGPGAMTMPKIEKLGIELSGFKAEISPVDRLPWPNGNGVIDGFCIEGEAELGLNQIMGGKAKQTSGAAKKAERSVTVTVLMIIGEDGLAEVTISPQENALTTEITAGPETISPAGISLRAITATFDVNWPIVIPNTGCQLNHFRGGWGMDKDADTMDFLAGVTVATIAKTPWDAPLADGKMDMNVHLGPQNSVGFEGVVTLIGFIETQSASITVELTQGGRPTGIEATTTWLTYLGPIPCKGSAGFHAWYDKKGAHFTGWGSMQIGLKKGDVFKKTIDCWLFDVTIYMPPFNMDLGNVGVEYGEFKHGSQSVWGVKGTLDLLGLFKTGMIVEYHGESVGVHFNTDSYVLADSDHIAELREYWRLEMTDSVPRMMAVPDDYGLYAFSLNSVTRTVNVPDTTDLVFAVSRIGDEPTLSLMTPGGIEITAATVSETITYTEMITDTTITHTNGVSETVDQTQCTFFVGDAEPGNWQVKLAGDTIDETKWGLCVLGAPIVPTLDNVQVASTGDASAEVSWALSTEVITTALNIHATQGPITSTLVVSEGVPIPDTMLLSHDEELTKTVTMTVFSGQAIAEDVPTPTDGSRGSAEVDLSHLDSGQYWAWVEANDNRNPPIRVYAPDPINVDNSATWPAAWTLPITVTPGYMGLHVEWEDLDHPDVSHYLVHVTDEPFTGLPPLSVGQVITASTSQMITETTCAVTTGDWLAPGVSHYVSIGVYNEHIDSMLWAPTVVSVPLGAEFELAANPVSVETVTGASAELALVATLCGDVTPTLALRTDTLPDGLTVGFEPSWVVPCEEGTSVGCVMTASTGMLAGDYVVPIHAVGGGVTETVAVHLCVEEPRFDLVATPASVMLGAGDTAQVIISAERYLGEADPIILGVVDAPDGLAWDLDPKVMVSGTMATLTITDTDLIDSGAYALTIEGEDGESTDALDILIEVVEPGFVVEAVPTDLGLAPGERGIYRLAVASVGGWEEPVTLTFDFEILPPGCSGGLGLVTVIPYTDTVTLDPPHACYLVIETTEETPEGRYVLPVHVSSAGQEDLVQVGFWVVEEGGCLQADLALADLSESTGIMPDSEVTYRLAVTNLGPCKAADVRLDVTLADELIHVSSQIEGGTCTYTGNTVECTVDSLEPGVGVIATITARVARGASGSVQSDAIVSAAQTDLGSGNDTVTLSTRIMPSAVHLPWITWLGLPSPLRTVCVPMIQRP